MHLILALCRYHICDIIVKPITRRYRCSFVELVAREDRQDPIWFVSHFWGTPFSQTVEMLSWHAEAHELPDDVTYWFCTLANVRRCWLCPEPTDSGSRALSIHRQHSSGTRERSEPTDDAPRALSAHRQPSRPHLCVFAEPARPQPAGRRVGRHAILEGNHARELLRCGATERRIVHTQQEGLVHFGGQSAL